MVIGSRLTSIEPCWRRALLSQGTSERQAASGAIHGSVK
jgi:hypothetical protein